MVIPLPVGEFARRTLLRVLARNTDVVTIDDGDPADSNPSPDLVFPTAPPQVMLRSLAEVGLTNQSQVEVLRADLKHDLPLIDGELTMVKLGPGAKIGKLRDFLAAALDLKV